MPSRGPNVDEIFPRTQEVLTAREVAALLRVHITTVYLMLKRGELPAFKIGADWRFRRSSIQKWMDRPRG